MNKATANLGLASEAKAEIEAVHQISSDLADAWDDLSDCATEPNPFYERWLLTPALKYLSPKACSLLTVRDGHCLIGLFPIVTAGHYGRLPVRNVQNWLHYHCFCGAPLIRRGREAAFWVAALDALDANPRLGAFLHISGLDPTMATVGALAKVRRADVVHTSTRALLSSAHTPENYYRQAVRKKKRKELARLRARLSELGTISTTQLAPTDDAMLWISDFLGLEASGWKGREGTALALDPGTSAFFREAMLGGHEAGKVEMMRMTVAGQTIAMSVNLMHPAGSFAFKTAFDEAFARYSPGVLLQIDTLNVMGRTAWVDSCAIEDHAMINSLWRERRTIVRVTIPLRGRRIAFAAARSLERSAAFIAGRR